MMQGIAGTYGVRDKPLVRRMLATIEHRGPDVREIFSEDLATLGAGRPERRLNERALATAEDESMAVASDSYIFNKEFLRRTIVPSMDEGVSDSKLMLGMYKAIGTRMFQYIDGAYAVAIVTGGKTILARDTYGLKPLYLSGDATRGTYSSEMKSQMLAGDKFVPFPPGRLFVSGQGFLKIQRKTISWADIGPGRNSVEHLRELVSRSVTACAAESDNLNVLLSGGIDSSVVAAAAAEAVPGIHTACVGTEQSEDLKMARLVAEHLGTLHKERTYDVEDMMAVLDRVVYHAESFDFPLIRSCIPNYLAASSFANKHSPTLCGEGGDEIFAGYDYMGKFRSLTRLTEERKALLDSGHLTGFQRVDRMTSCASLDGRMPLMSHRIVDFGLGLEMRELVGKSPGQSKLVLRKAFRDALPKPVVWRRKQKFSDGAGSMRSLVQVAEKMITDKEFVKETKSLPKGRVRTKEELLYFRVFKKFYDSPSAIDAVGSTAIL